MKFIHCADLHIDSPFKDISEIAPELGELLRNSTYQAFNNIVDLAINEEVDCVLVAGDIYDSADKSLQAQLRFRNSLNRLSEAGIATFIVHGNHDPLDSWSATLEWPEKVTVFRDEVTCEPLTRNGEVIAQIYGISYAKRDTFDNLALQFEAAGDGVPCIALLHANIGSDTGHKAYAPCSIDDLIARKMDYWALGHVHNPSILRPCNPAIVYSGCTQSRNPRETGKKGCYLVTIESAFDPDIRFMPTDVVRYKSDSIDISDYSKIDEVISSINDRCEKISAAMDNRHVIIRISLTGRTSLYPELIKVDAIKDIQDEVRESFSGREPGIWLEKINLAVFGTYDLKSLKRGNDLVADIILLYEELEDSDGEIWEGLQDSLGDLFNKWQGHRYLYELSQEELWEIARESRDWTLDKIIGAD